MDKREFRARMAILQVSIRLVRKSKYKENVIVLINRKFRGFGIIE